MLHTLSVLSLGKYMKFPRIKVSINTSAKSGGLTWGRKHICLCWLLFKKLQKDIYCITFLCVMALFLSLRPSRQDREAATFQKATNYWRMTVWVLKCWLQSLFGVKFLYWKRLRAVFFFHFFFFFLVVVVCLCVYLIPWEPALAGEEICQHEVGFRTLLPLIIPTRRKFNVNQYVCTQPGCVRRLFSDLYIWFYVTWSSTVIYPG